MQLPQRSYDRVAAVYDLLALAWSAGAIGAAGRAVAQRVEPGQRVLVAGVGGGRDAAALAARGADLTLVDLSPRMLARAAARVAEVDGVAVVHCADVLGLAPGDHDVVCAHYFLNVFGPQDVPEALARLAAQLRPGGLLSIADFAPLTGNAISRLGQRVHYALPLAVFSALGLCARHPIYDYAAMLPPELVLVGLEDHRVGRVGPCWHRTWFARRVS